MAAFEAEPFIIDSHVVVGRAGTCADLVGCVRLDGERETMGTLSGCGHGEWVFYLFLFNFIWIVLGKGVYLFLKALVNYITSL